MYVWQQQLIAAETKDGLHIQSKIKSEYCLEDATPIPIMISGYNSVGDGELR
jgi:hypothetical protein